MRKINSTLAWGLTLGLVVSLAGAPGAQASEEKAEKKVHVRQQARPALAGKSSEKKEERRHVTVIRGEKGKEPFVLGEFPRMRRGYLGVSLTDLTPELRAHFGVPEESGVLVAKVEPGSPADKAGVKVGDIVTSIGGEEIKSSWDVSLKVRNQEDGDQVPLEVWRKGRVQTLTATVEQRERAEMDLAPFFKERDGKPLAFHIGEDGQFKMLEGGDAKLLEGFGGWPEGTPRVRVHRMSSEREAELEKKLKALEKRLEELEKLLEKK
jgi:membrane-associated protease RseP (regulator of RpoE activity)